jgi:hypothetical protein
MLTLFLLFILAAPASDSSSPINVVRAFYDQIIKLHPIGIPTGEAKRALWPLLSSRLAQRLDALQACEDDYYRRNKKKLESEQLKPSIGWIESGLFSGENEQSKQSVLNNDRPGRCDGRGSGRESKTGQYLLYCIG